MYREKILTRYLIDIRQMGSVKRQIGALSRQLQEEFGLEKMLVIPHITLAGPFSTDNEKRLIEDFSRVCMMQREIPRYEIGGFGFFDTTRVVFVTIMPDETLRQFRYLLAQTILPYCTLRNYDLEPAGAFRFHSTLAMKLDWFTFLRIKWRFRHQPPVSHTYHPIRATLLKNSRILCEYDFAQGRMLTRAQAESRATRLRDSKMLRAWGDSEGYERV